MTRLRRSILCALSRAPVFAFALALAALAGAAGPGVALAQDDEPEREHRDVHLARALSGRGWYDLAYAVLDDLDKSAPSVTVREQARFLRADFEIAEANDLADPAERAAKVSKARAFFEDYAKKNAKTELGAEARLRVGEIYMQEGDAGLARLRAETMDSESRQQTRADAIDRYTKAEKYFSELEKEYAAALDKVSTPMSDDPSADPTASPEEQEARYRLAQASFLGAKVLYQHGQLFEKGTKEWTDRLAKAVERLDKVNFEYADTIVGYEAAIFLGLAQRDLGKTDEAIAAFDAAAALMSLFEEGEPLDPGIADIVTRGLFLKAQTLNQARSFDRALKAATDFYATFPDLVEANDRLALAMKLEEAEARAGIGDVKKAVEIINKVQDMDPQGPLGALAREKLGQITGAGGGPAVAVAPDRAIGAAETLIDKGRAPEGLQRFRLLIADLEAAGDDGKQYLPKAWSRLGRAYHGLKRFDEAAACFEQVARRFKDSPEAPGSLFYAGICRQSMNGARPNDFDKKAYLDTLRALSTNYANDTAAKASAFLLGSERLEARDYPNAAKEYEKVTEAAGEYYDAALYQAAVAWLLEARSQAKKNEAAAKDAFGKARVAFEKAIQWAEGGAEAKGADMAGDRGATLRKLGFQARSRLAEILLHPLVKDVKAALEAAKAAERSATEAANPDPERIAEARLLMVQAYLAEDDVEQAEQALEALAAAAPESPRRVHGEREVAVALDLRSRDPKVQGDAAALASLRSRAATHYAQWIDVAVKAGVTIPPADALVAGDQLFKLAVQLNGLPDDTLSFGAMSDLSELKDPKAFKLAGDAYAFAIAAGEAKLKDAWLVLVKLGECRGFTKEFAEARQALERAVASEKLVKGQEIDLEVARAKGALVFAHADVARACIELAAKDSKGLDVAVKICTQVIFAVPQGGDLWWRCKYDLLLATYLKGQYDLADAGISSLKRQNPNFDGDKYGFKSKLEALAKKIAEKKPASGKGKTSSPRGK